VGAAADRSAEAGGRGEELRLIALLALMLVALAASPAAAAEVDRCGTITEIFIGDLISGGYIAIDGDKYLVGGVDPRPAPIVLPSPALATVGARICFNGTVEPLAGTPGVFRVTAGTFALRTTALPSTSTGSSATSVLVGLAAGLIVAGSLLFTRKSRFRSK
jgi:LPXTG-motif cell wall-anchored protein